MFFSKPLFKIPPIGTEKLPNLSNNTKIKVLVEMVFLRNTEGPVNVILKESAVLMFY